MRTLTQKPKAARQMSPARHTEPVWAKPRHSRDAGAAIHRQLASGSQAVPQLLQARSEDPETIASTELWDCFAYDFTQIPVRSQACTDDLRPIARTGIAGPACRRLPHLDRIQRSFGPQHNLGGVKAYVGGNAAHAARFMGAEAYTSGERVAFRTAPGLRTAAHEAVHVVQQRSGVRISGGIGEKGDVYERHADAVADCVVAGRSSEHLLGVYAGAADNRSVSSTTVQCLQQSLPYVGPLLSYLNPRNQLARIALPGLSDHQEALLIGIFGNSLATSIIRLNPNSLLATGDCYRTTGNIINMPGTSISDRHLIHEAAHVWQSQNTLFGVGYAVSALRAQAIAQVLGGDWQRAYDYANVERYRIPWRFWNAEQQAAWIEDHRRLPSGWMLEGALPNFGVESAGIE